MSWAHYSEPRETLTLEVETPAVDYGRDGTLRTPEAIESQLKLKALKCKPGWLLLGYHFCGKCARVSRPLESTGGCCFCGSHKLEWMEGVK